MKTPESRLKIYPAISNPFKDSIVISWEQAEAAAMMLEIFDVNGKRVLQQRVQATPGKQQWEWDGKDGSGGRLANGAYVAVLKSGTLQGSIQLVKMGN